MENTSEYKRLVEQLRLNSNEVGAIKYSRFVRFTFKELTYFLNKNFNLNDIAITLSRDLGINVRYHSLWVAYTRALKKNNSIINIEESKENVITKKEESVSDEIKDSEKNIELDWIKKPEFRQINNPYLIKEIIKYELTEDDIRSLKLPPHPIKCLELITDLGERRKAERIDKIYFGK